MIFFLVGFMGSGKTHFGKQWAAEEDFAFIDLDEQIERSEGTSIANLFDTKGESYFRAAEKRELQNINLSNSTIVACGGGTACYSDNIEWMNANGLTVYLSKSEAELFQHLQNQKEQRPLISALSADQLKQFIHTELEARRSWYQQAKIHIRVGIIEAGLLRKIFSLPVYA